MKRAYALIGLSLVLMIFSIRNFTLDIDSKTHYFANGVIFGIGIYLFVSQILKRRKKNNN